MSHDSRSTNRLHRAHRLKLPKKHRANLVSIGERMAHESPYAIFKNFRSGVVVRIIDNLDRIDAHFALSYFSVIASKDTSDRAERAFAKRVLARALAQRIRGTSGILYRPD
jgi:hypothetical protein